SDTAAVLRRAWVADLGGGGTVVERTAAEFAFAYRHSSVTTTEVVVSAEFAVAEKDSDEAGAEIDEIVRWRREHQPGGANAGSVFTNPPGDSAGRLIDAAGLKGFRVGSALVSDKHANFFQAGDSADDVHELVAEVRLRVEEATGVALEPELRMVGFGDASLSID
ncbi:MAG: UDP-N-acetylmuramate dehydrogenase, partial [Candidatus Rokuibacteriota bacterium]